MEAQNSDKETTSLEKPSLPASDGFQNPVQSSELSSKICNPANQLLDRSVSAPASICSPISSLAEPTDPRAMKSLEPSGECQISPEKEHPLLFRPLSNNASLPNTDGSLQAEEVTCCSPTCLSQNTLKETFADSLKECNAKEQGHGQDPPLEVTPGNSLADTAAKHGQNKEVPEQEEQKNQLPRDYQICKEPVNEHLEKQNETTDPERPRGVGGVEKPAAEEEHCKGIHPENSPAEMRGNGEWQAENGSVSDVSSDPPSMEVESLKSDSSLNDPVSICDVLQSEDTNEISAEYELPNLTSENSSCPSSIHQLDTDPGASSEESYFSLASALKELHKLLIISRKGDCKILPSEEVSQLEIAHKEQANQAGLPEDKHEDVDPNSQEQNCPFSKESSEDRNAEQPLGEVHGDCGAENVCVTCISHTQSAGRKDVTEMQKLSGKSDLIMLNSAMTSADQQQSFGQTNILAECDRNPTNLTSEANASVPAKPTLNKDVSEDTQSLLTGAPGRSSTSTPKGPWLSWGFEEPRLHLPAGSSELTSAASPPPAFPVADINRILCAGFTMQEALEALEQADGNADLALLILLAKGIVVPT
ncbi:PREDICTED: regulatory solute carrier protein family 1 member 1 [Tinamus guttatus]|uniref:regulatory solute carrier protein family 1 member 1 n=1 Tax=Tinamus guttatus TaxID=94827 RepID=UPI00052E6B6B|nr:PREDICTED: regulatory solute carrier protein family 1 member 1 [Tinamus guttatus]